MKYIVKFFFVICILLSISACNTHLSHIYSAIDSVEQPSKYDSIFILLPDDGTSKEKDVAIMLKNEMRRGGFSVAIDIQKSKWVLAFAIDRTPYSISLSRLGFDSNNKTVLEVNSSNTYNVLYTDIVIYLNLFKTSELESDNPQLIWDGWVVTNKRVFRILPHSTLKNILDKFGENFNGSITVDKSYQKAVNRE